MSFSFRTIKKENHIQLKEKGSSFIAYLFPIKSEEEFKKRLTELKSEFADASHHCYAYRLDKSGNHDRSSDDGEPSGTAGKPIMNQLISKDLHYCAVIVVRYFGGTKLGTPGLIKAYKESAKAIIENAEIIEETVKIRYKISFPFDRSSEINRILNSVSAEIIKKEADEKLHLYIELPMEKNGIFEEKLRNLNYVNLVLSRQ